MGQINQFIRNLTCMPIFLYQRLLKPIMKPCCRFHPSCSDYSIEAIKQLGILKGGVADPLSFIAMSPLGEKRL